MGAKENTPNIMEDDIQPLDNMETQVRKFRNSIQSDSHISTESMALTTLSKDDSVPDKKKKKEKKEKNKKDKGLNKPLMGANNFEAQKPLRGKRHQHSHENHFDDGYRKPRHVSHVRRQDDHDFCYTCLRNALHCYNIVVLIMGMGAVGVGVWLLLTDFSAREWSAVIGSNLFEIGTYLILGGGGMVALLAFCGCCGTMREDKCILGFYGIILALVFCAFIVGGVLAFMFREEMTNDLKHELVKSIHENYADEMTIRGDAHKRLVVEAWDSLQRKLKCCGAYGNESSEYSWAIYKTGTLWYVNTNDKWPMVPESCCNPDEKKLVCTGENFKTGPPTIGRNNPRAQKNPALYTEGCYEKIVDYLLDHSIILGAVSFAIPAFLIIGTVIAFCLCARVKPSDDDDDDEDKAHV